MCKVSENDVTGFWDIKDYRPYTLHMQTRQFSRYFKGRNMRALSQKKAKYFIKTFAFDDIWKKFFGKTFSEWAKSKKKIHRNDV